MTQPAGFDGAGSGRLGVNKGKGPRLHNKLAHLRSAFVNARRESIDDDAFVVNDLQFAVPPTAIKVQGHDTNFEWETLRTNSSLKARSGHGTLIITVNMVFARDSRNHLSAEQIINQDLLPLIHEFKKTPFCQLENELLRRVLPVGPEESIGAALVGMNVSVMQGLPEALQATLQFIWFNYKPFTPEFLYRRDWTNKDIEEERQLYLASGDDEYRQTRGAPGKVYNALAQQSTKFFGRSAPAMLHFREDKMRIHSYEDDHIDVVPSSFGYRAIDLTGDLAFKFYGIRVPTDPPPGALEIALREAAGITSFRVSREDTGDPEIGDLATGTQGSMSFFNSGGKRLRATAGTVEAWTRMQRAALTDGIQLYVVSALRSNARQAKKFQKALEKYGSFDVAKFNVAPPRGYVRPNGKISKGSKHLRGIALDILWKGRSGGTNSEDNERLWQDDGFKWLDRNAAKFGFQNYKKEAWHWNYTGQEPSAAVASAPDLTKEEKKEHKPRGVPANLYRKIRLHASNEGIPLPLALGLVSVESNFNPKAESRPSRNNALEQGSPGAQGLTQVLWKYNKDKNLFDPDVNLQTGFAYLSKLVRKYGTYTDALMAYNWGPGNLDAAKKGEKRIPAKTRGYAGEIAKRARDRYGGADIAHQIENMLPAVGPQQFTRNPRGVVQRKESKERLVREQQVIVSKLLKELNDNGAAEDADMIASLNSLQGKLGGLEVAMISSDFRELTDSAVETQGAAGEGEKNTIQDLLEAAQDRAYEIWRDRVAPTAQGWQLIEDSITKKKMFRLPITYDIPVELKAVNVVAMSFTLSNSITPLPIVGWRYPTLQYTGSLSPKVELTIAFTGEEGRVSLNSIMSMLSDHVNSAISARELHKHLGIRIDNSLVNAMGIGEVFLEDWSISTSPSMKDTVTLSLSFVDNTVDRSDTYSVPKVNGMATTKNELLAVLLERGGFITKVDVAGLDDNETEEEFHKIRRKEVARRHILGQGDADDLDEGTAAIGKHGKARIARQAKERRFSRTKTIANKQLAEMGRRLFLILAQHGREIDDYPELYGLGTYFQANKLSGPSWILSREKKDSEIYEGRTGQLNKFLNKMEVFLSHELLDWALAAGPDEDPEVSTIINRSNLSGRIDAKPCYPDLQLPPNPISGKVTDMNPDFYFWNVSDIMHSSPKEDGSQTTDLKAAYKKRGRLALERSYNAFVNEQVGPKEGTLSRNPDFYAGDRNLEPNDDITEGMVTAPMNNAPPDNSRRSGKPSRHHSHAQAKKGDSERDIFQRKVPEGRDVLEQDQTLVGTLDIFDKYMDNHWVEEKLTMRRAYPTFKVFFIEEDQPNKIWKVLDDFYGLNSIKEIRISRSRKIAADTCVIQITNVAGTLTNRKFPEFNNAVFTKISSDPDGKEILRATSAKELLIDTQPSVENPFHSTLLREGTKIQVRLGYSNDYEELETVFNGQIVGMEGNEILTLVCQSYATELVAAEYGKDPEAESGWWDADTDEILSEMLGKSEVRHFGRWALTDLHALPFYSRLRPDGSEKLGWGFVDSPKDDNIFCENWDDLNIRTNYNPGDWNWVDYVLFHTTAWDVFKEMELRHPGWIASPVPYEDRMTMFFGTPSMNYFWRDPKSISELRDTLLFKEGLLGQLQSAILHTKAVASSSTTTSLGIREISAGGGKITPQDLENFGEFTDWHEADIQRALGTDQNFISKAFNMIHPVQGINYRSRTNALVQLKKFKKAAKRGLFKKLAERARGGPVGGIEDLVLGDTIRPFRNYHFITSEHDIIQNNIRADHRGTYNAVTLDYNDIDVAGNSLDIGDGVDKRPTHGTKTISVDDHISPHHKRHTFMSYPNCAGEFFATRYGVGFLCQSLKDTYKGEVTILGDATIKPYDIVYLLDSYTDMAGPIEVEAVVHTLSNETGFITEITPDLCVVARRGAIMGMADALEQVAVTTFGTLAAAATAYAGASAVMGTGAVVADAAAIGFTAGAAEIAGAGAAATGLATTGTGVAVTGGGSALGAAVGGVGVTATGAAALTWGGLIAGSAAVLLVAAGGFKFLRHATSREPLVITPLIRAGKPFISGVEGFEIDGLIASIGKEWRHFMTDLDRASNAADLTLRTIATHIWRDSGSATL